MNRPTYLLMVAAFASIVAGFENFTALSGRNPFPGGSSGTGRFNKVTWGYYFLGAQPYQSPAAIIAQGVK